MLFSFFLFYFICCERRSKPLPLVNVKSKKKKKKLQFDYSNQGTWKKIIQSQRFLKTKNSQGFFFANEPKTFIIFRVFPKRSGTF